MGKLNCHVQKQIKQLREDGFSCNEISNELSIGLSTAKKYGSDFELNKKGLLRKQLKLSKKGQQLSKK